MDNMLNRQLEFEQSALSQEVKINQENAIAASFAQKTNNDLINEKFSDLKFQFQEFKTQMED